MEPPMPFVLRWIFAFLLIAATFNPSPWNFVQWARANVQTELPLTVLFGLILLVGYIVYLRATLRSIGAVGMALVLALVGAVLWVLYDWGYLSLDNTNVLVWLAILALSLVLGVGMSWSFVRRALTGQYDMDDVDE